MTIAGRAIRRQLFTKKSANILVLYVELKSDIVSRVGGNEKFATVVRRRQQKTAQWFLPAEKAQSRHRGAEVSERGHVHVEFQIRELYS